MSAWSAMVPALRPRMPAPRRARALAVLAGVALLVALLAGAAGWLLGGRAAPSAAPDAPAATAITAGPLSLAVPGTWSEPTPADGDAQVFVTAPGLETRAIVLVAPVEDATLVPDVLQPAAGGSLGEPRPTRLAGLPAWRYGPIVGRRSQAEIVVAPTTAGVLAVACTAPAELFALVSGCSDDVQLLDAGGARPLRPAEDLAFRLRLGPELDRLDEARVAGRAALAEESVRAAAARSLARDHRRAAAALEPLAPTGSAAALVDALRDTGRAYASFARSPRQARQRVQSAEAALERAVGAAG